MICKIIQGAGFSGACNYLLTKDGAEVIGSKDIRDYDPKLAAQDFITIASQNKRVKKKETHIVVSFHKYDTNITNEKMKAMAEKIIEGMGFENAQYLIVRHNDTEHPHFHILMNRIDMEGKTVDDKYSKIKLAKIRKELEKEHPELTPANGIDLDNTNLEKLKGDDKVRYYIYNAINKEIKNSRNIYELIDKLKKNCNIETTLKFKRGSIDVIEGIKFCYKNKTFSGSKINKQCSYLNLIKAMSHQLVNIENKRNDNIKQKSNTGILNNITKDADYNNALGIKKTHWSKDKGKEI
jgi:transcriptional regulator NrdR family protein